MNISYGERISRLCHEGSFKVRLSVVTVSISKYTLKSFVLIVIVNSRFLLLLQVSASHQVQMSTDSTFLNVMPFVSIFVIVINSGKVGRWFPLSSAQCFY